PISGRVVSAYAVGFGGVAEAVAKMSFGNEVGATISLSEEKLFDYAYGSIVVEAISPINSPSAELIGSTTDSKALVINGESFCLSELRRVNSERFASIYPDKGNNKATAKVEQSAPRTVTYSGERVEKPIVYIPIFPGTNCDYDTAKAFRKAGAEPRTSVFCNLTSEDTLASIATMVEMIDSCHIFMLSGGFSAGDEPDGSGKFIATVLNNRDVTAAIHRLIEREGLILGICNGFQALVKSGLLPYGRLGMVTEASPTLFRNDVNRHISQIVSTRVSTISSPWLSSFEVGDIHSIAVSHGEGKFVVSEELAHELFEAGQVAFQYVDLEGEVTAEAPYNPNGSSYAIEGIISKDGRILGKMGHTERYEENLFKNIEGEKHQEIFENAVNYFRKK
ncbi:MAG: phosphoribosylformylglycinamidine synthase subunit PurQ, partial [Rikenellaceae bacterium]